MNTLLINAREIIKPYTETVCVKSPPTALTASRSAPATRPKASRVSAHFVSVTRRGVHLSIHTYLVIYLSIYLYLARLRNTLPQARWPLSFTVDAIRITVDLGTRHQVEARPVEQRPRGSARPPARRGTRDAAASGFGAHSTVARARWCSECS